MLREHVTGASHRRAGDGHLPRDARVRLLDAAVTCLGAVRELVSVCEDVVRERRDRLAGDTEVPENPEPTESRSTRIDLTY
jgi:hypothetical protein